MQAFQILFSNGNENPSLPENTKVSATGYSKLHHLRTTTVTWGSLDWENNGQPGLNKKAYLFAKNIAGNDNQCSYSQICQSAPFLL